MLVGRPFGAPGPNLTLLEVGAYTLEPSQLGFKDLLPRAPAPISAPTGSGVDLEAAPVLPTLYHD